VAEEPGLEERVRAAHLAGRLRATTDGASAATEADVIVLIVPVMLDDSQRPDYRHMDDAVVTVAPGVRSGATVIFETTLPVGDTRSRYVPMLEAASGLAVGQDLFVAFSPERLYTGAVFVNLATYPKLVGGVDVASTDRAVRFYASVLDAEIVAMSSAESAELSKLADTTYRFVNIAFANQLADYAQKIGLDVQEVIEAANSQPYSHIHQPGLGAGGHCIPVYPQFIAARAPGFDLISVAKRVNDERAGLAVRMVKQELGDLRGTPVLVLGLTYRAGVNETAYSVARHVVNALADEGARVAAWDPLLTADEIRGFGAEPWDGASQSDARVIVVQTADPTFRDLDLDSFPDLEVVFDGRDSLRRVTYPPHVRVVGFGIPPRGDNQQLEASQSMSGPDL
jgi:UDP-N-acetyl-D-mannosaminuronic acid dehydrogenase